MKSVEAGNQIERRFRSAERRWIRWRIWLLLALFLLSESAGAQSSPAQPTVLRTLRTAHEVHSLRSEEAARAYPVHLRATVTYYDPYIDSRHGALFLHDSTGGIFASVAARPILPIRPGTVVEVLGRSGAGDFAPIVASPQIKVIGESSVPAHASRVTMQQLLSGAVDGQWVEVEGLVHGVRRTANNAIFDIATIAGPISATTRLEEGADYNRLVDARIRLHGNAAPVFNLNRQMVGVHLYLPALAQVQVVQPSSADPFAMPILPISRLLRFSPDLELPHRVHVQGRVTLHWPGRMLCIQQAGDGLCMQTVQMAGVKVGDLVDVAGFPAISEYKPTLEDATFQLQGSGPALPSAEAVTAGLAFQVHRDASLVSIEGELIGEDRAASDPTLMLRAGNFLFPAILPKGSTAAGKPPWQEGSRLRVTGICVVEVDAQSTTLQEGRVRPQSARILLRSLDDVTVLRTPTWWTPGHALRVLGILVASGFAALVWIVVLRRRVDQQTEVIRSNEARLRHISQHDALTNLPNRNLLQDRLNMALERSKRFQAGLGLLMVDLDRFKEVNDSLGHHAGDQMLCEVARRIRASVRKTDTVSRMGGDEFIVLLPDLQTPAEAETIAGKIVAAVSTPIEIGQLEVPISVSVGVCTYPTGGTDTASLLQSVDTAMYHAKAQGRNGFQIFTPNMAQATRRKLELESALKQALESGEFALEYQPIVSLKTGKPIGVEASLCWRTKDLGLIMPGDFLPLAEQTGLIVPLGEWAIEEACRQMVELERHLGRSLLLAIRVSPRQFQQANLAKEIERILAAHQRQPSSLEIEVTENLLMNASLNVTRSLEELRGLGVRLAIDDFGIGFSSLSYIAHSSVDHIRIDSSFIRTCTTDARSAAVTWAMIAMARTLDIEAVGDGVETAEQLRFLQEAQCGLAQGDYLGRLVAAPDLSAILASFEPTVS